MEVSRDLLQPLSEGHPKPPSQNHDQESWNFPELQPVPFFFFFHFPSGCGLMSSVSIALRFHHSSNGHYCQVPACSHQKYPGEQVRRGPAPLEFTGLPWLPQQQQGEVESRGLFCQVWGIWGLRDNSMLSDIKGGKLGLTRTNK